MGKEYRSNMGDSEPVVRVVRKTEAFNPLLQRVVLGKSKRSTYGLPQNQFVYGKPNIHDGEGCAEVLSTWVEHHANPDSLPGRDFMALNKRATIVPCQNILYPPLFFTLWKASMVPSVRKRPMRVFQTSKGIPRVAASRHCKTPPCTTIELLLCPGLAVIPIFIARETPM